jgi:hypothetical protein
MRAGIACEYLVRGVNTGGGAAFRSGNAAGRRGAFAAAAVAEGRVVWADACGGLLAVDFGEGGSAWTSCRHGTLLVRRGTPRANRIAWIRV